MLLAANEEGGEQTIMKTRNKRMQGMWGGGCRCLNSNSVHIRSPSCLTSCSKESSKIITLPSCQHLVSSPTLMLAPSQPMIPRCTRSFLFVGPLWGMICVPGVMAENMEWR
jgi:hypothetical protein